MKTDEQTTVESNIKRDLDIVDGEIIENPDEAESESFDDEKTIVSAKNQQTTIKDQTSANQTKNQKIYLLLPFLFLTVALFGGLRLSAADNAFLFLKPALVCLIFAVILLFLFARANLIKVHGWFSEDYSGLKNVANAAVLITLFAASAQIFNALLPERGLPFWLIAFCFFWTLIMNIFSEFDVKKLIKSLGAMFGLAFVFKYFILANLTAPTSESWWRGILENPSQEIFTYIFDLPRFSAGTGYIQFFTLIFYLTGLFLLPNSTESSLKN
jgi:C4-dicarboxylate anaerobic carrier